MTRPAGRHCWADPPGHPGGPWPGLVVEWRRAAIGWEGRTVYCLTDPRDGGMRVVEAWLPSRCLTAVQA